MNTNKHFDIHTSIVFRLGDELISDEIQALVELVKNSYDADASWVEIVVNTEDPPPPNSKFQSAKGFITIEDNGHGMTEEMIDNGWLFISNSSKRSLKQAGKTTPIKKRTPLGDKGLGRLGVQRLGWNVEFETRPHKKICENLGESNRQYHVALDWKVFQEQARLSKVNVPFNNITPATRETGTKFIISELKNEDVWIGEKAISRLTVELSKIISPFKRIRDFIIIIKVNGKDIRLAEISEEVRQTAPLTYKLDYKSRVFKAKGKAKYSYLNPVSTSELEQFKQLIAADDGEGFFKFLLENPRAKQFQLTRAKESGWFLEFDYVRKLTDFDKMSKIESSSLTSSTDSIVNIKPNQSMIADPGRFEGEIDFFYIGASSEQNIFDKKSEYKNYIKELSGIRVYRDGFGIRVDDDWLGLRSAQTSGTSFFVLRPDNTMGFIAISASHNANLRETTNREGFMKNAYFDNFYEILQQFVKFTQQVQSFIRRGWVDYRRLHERRFIEQNLQKPSTPENIVKAIHDIVNEGQKRQRELASAITELTKVVGSPENKQATLGILTEDDKNRITKIINEAKISSEYFNSLEERTGSLKLVIDQVADLREQLEQSYETMGLGLTAETLSHEISNIINQLLFRTERFAQYAQKNNLQDGRIWSYIDFVQSSANGLRKQLAHFAPSLKYVREKRTEIDIVDFFNDLQTFYESRFKEKKITLKIDIRHESPFVVYMSKGKLTQVIDNLILNSEYWLEEDIRLGNLDQGTILIEIHRPYIRISDNGRGIDPQVEASLFEPFVTMKQAGKGRGLGLFIVRQLLDSEDCNISLLADRNKANKLYKFEISLYGRVLDQ